MSAPRIVKLNNVEYELPDPTSFRTKEFRLIKQLTGEAFENLTAFLDQITAMASVAIWRANPTWSLLDAQRYIDNLEMLSVEVVGGDEPDSPPEDRAEESLSPDSSSESTITPADFATDLA